MLISQFSGIANKIKFLESINKDNIDADNTLCYIECFNEERKIKNNYKLVNIVRFSIDGVYTEIFLSDKSENALLKESVSVNLFDLWNIIDNCKDDIISFDIVGDYIVIESFFNETLNLSEIQAQLPIKSRNFDRRFGDVINIKSTLKINPTASYTILRNINPEYMLDGLHIKSNGTNLVFVSDYHGVRTELEYINDVDFKVDGSFDIYLPFNVFNMMTSTGQVDMITMNISDYIVTVNTDEYVFEYKLVNVLEDMYMNVEYKEFTIIHKETASSVISLLQKMDISSNALSMFTMKKHIEKIMEVSVVRENRYNVHAILPCATLYHDDNASLSMDTNLINNILQRTPVDAIAIKVDDSLQYVYMESCDNFVNRKTYYDINKFYKFRKTL